MKINRKIISDRELFEKSIDVVEYLVNAKIGLQISKGDNWCNFGGIDKIDSKKMYLINLSSSRNSAIPRYTALIHELGHILYETPFTPIKKLLRKWDPQTYWQDTSHAVDLYHTIFNVLEDQRIESQISKSYLGHKKRFEKTRHDLGKAGFGDYEDMENPAFGLLAIRFMRDDLVKNTKYYHIYKQALDNVEETDRFGALRVLISIKDCIDEFLAKKESSKQGTQNHNLKTNSLGNYSNVYTSLSQEEKAKIINDIERRSKIKLSENEKQKIIEQGLQSKREKYETKKEKHNPLGKPSSPDFSIPPELNKERHSQDQIRELLKNGKEEGEKQHQEIREKLIARNRTDNTLPNVKKILRPASNYTIDYKTAKGLNKVFKLLKLRSKSAIDFTGSQIDINEYVENLTKGTNLNRCYENTKPDTGASIIISIDASSSMISDQKIIFARNLVGTLFKSINGVKNTEIRGNIWGSNTSGEIGITEINNIQDVKQISVGTINDTYSYPYTPLHMGLEYSMKMLKEMRGRKKLLILITDGFPNYHRNGDSIPNNIYNQQCKKSLQKVLKVTPNVICLLVGPEHDEIKRIMTNIFTSKRFIIVPNMQKASQNIVKKFRQFIAKNVQNPF